MGHQSIEGQPAPPIPDQLCRKEVPTAYYKSMGSFCMKNFLNVSIITEQGPLVTTENVSGAAI